MADDDFDSLSIDHRLPGWQKRYLYLVEEELAKPFSWVDAHCVDLMAASVMACLGPDHPALKAIPRFEKGADTIRYLAEQGGLEKVLDRYFKVVPTAHAFEADLVLLKGQDGFEEAGAVVLDGQIVGKHPPKKSESGYTRIAFRLPMQVAYKVYRV
jgi:hypothetical protein